MKKLTPEIQELIDTQIKDKKILTYNTLRKLIAQKFGVQIAKSTISRRVKALGMEFSPGRKRFISEGKKPGRSIFLDRAGAFFLKGAELEMGLLPTINQLLVTGTESTPAKKVLRLAQEINVLLLYAPIFELKTIEEIAGYNQQGLLYLAEQKALPHPEKIAQYLQFLEERKLLLPMIKEVTRICAEALVVRVEGAGRTFFLDAQGRTVWPNSRIPRYFNATINKTTNYIKSVFLSPAPQNPLILQACPGYTFLPPEMFDLIQCFEQAEEKGVSRIVVVGKFGENLAFWQDLKPPGKCFFVAPLSPWQYARLADTQIVRDFQQFQLGLEKEAIAVADADVSLFNPQLNKNIRLRAALVRRKEERLALITNISRRQERYIRKIVEQYFWRWPECKVKTYYDLLEEAHAELLVRTTSPSDTTSLFTIGYSQKAQDTFRLFLEHLHRYVQSHFLPAEYAQESLISMQEKFYQHSGYLKIKQHGWEVFLCPFPTKKLQEAGQFACTRFNQNDINFSSSKSLRIYLP